MEPSRDDFIIAIRSAFLKKGTKQRFSLIVLLFFSVGFIVLGKFNFFALNYLKIGINELVYRTSFVASLPEKYIGHSFRAVEKHIKIYKDYNLIEEKLNKLTTKKYEINFLESENKRLKKILEDITYSSDAVIITNQDGTIVNLSTFCHYPQPSFSIITGKRASLVISCSNSNCALCM